MPIVRAMRLINAVESGTMNSAALETALGDAGRLSEFQAAMSQLGLARRVASSSTSVNTIISSPIALAAAMRVGVSAQELATNVVSYPLLSASAVAMKAATAQVAGMKSWVDKFPSVARTFTNTNNAGAARINSIAYGAGLYVAVGDYGSIITSPDLVTWTARTHTAGTTVATVWMSVGFANGLFVAVGYNATQAYAYTSPDGITWTSRTLPSSGTVIGGGVRNLIHDGTRWCLLVQTSASVAAVWYATDPTAAWTAATGLSTGANDTYNFLIYKAGVGYLVARTDNAPLGGNYFISASITSAVWVSRSSYVSAAYNMYTQLVAGSEYIYSLPSSINTWMRSRDGHTWETMGYDSINPDSSMNPGYQTMIFVSGTVIRTSSTAGRPMRATSDHGMSSKNFYAGSTTNNVLAYVNGIIFNLSNTTAYSTHIPIV
jgi:hypothetical protein